MAKQLKQITIRYYMGIAAFVVALILTFALDNMGLLIVLGGLLFLLGARAAYIYRL